VLSHDAVVCPSGRQENPEFRGDRTAGRQFEGIRGGHRIVPGRGRAATAVFSILSDEWPRVRELLGRRLCPFAVAEGYAVRTFAAL
jgi:hypothetical protein